MGYSTMVSTEAFESSNLGSIPGTPTVGLVPMHTRGLSSQGGSPRMGGKERGSIPLDSTMGLV